MAEAKAGQPNAQEKQQYEPPKDEQGVQTGDEVAEKKNEQAKRTYTQEEVDRILGKVRKNARYLGRKEAEAELRSQGATQAQAREAVDHTREQTQADTAPVRRDDESYEDFLIRKAEYAGRQSSRDEHQKLNEKERERTVVEQRAKTEREFKQRANAIMTEIPDFAETIEAAEDVMISMAMGEAIQESPLGPRILYHLVKNPDESTRIAGLSPSAAAREIGKLEATIEAELKKAEGGADDDADAANAEAQDQARRTDGTFKQKKGSSQAPPPIEPVGPRAANTSQEPSDKDDIATWLLKRNAQLAREGRR